MTTKERGVCNGLVTGTPALRHRGRRSEEPPRERQGPAQAQPPRHSLGTRTDQKVGRDAIERLAVLKKDYARLKAEADRLLGQ